MTATREISASLEDYLEAIFHIAAEKGAARAKDISRRMKVNSSSVTGALRALAERALVNYAPYDVITLTPKGTRIAKDVIRRHEILRDFFVKVLAVEEAEAEEGACKMEHAVPRSILERLVEYIDFLESCPRAGTTWISGFGYYCEHGSKVEDCERCVSNCLDDVKRKGRESADGGASVGLELVRPGQKARVVKVRSRGGAAKRLAEMGITPGALLEVERVSPVGDPVDVKIKGYHLSLRRDEVAGIQVEIH